MANKKKIPTLADRASAGLIDLTKTGPLTYRELRALNDGLPEESISNQQLPDRPGNRVFDPEVAGRINYTNNLNEDFGESIYDDSLANQYQYENYQDLRGERQSWMAQIGAGLAKGAVLAGTTFLDGTLGLLIGAGTAIAEGRISGLWDNDFSRAMQAVNEASEELMPNYYTDEERNEPWYTNIFTSNFLGDKFLKNLGFSVGALYSGGVWSRGLSGLAKGIGVITNSVNAPKMITTGIGATMSAVNEGRIEALNNSNDWYNTQKAMLDSTLNKELGAFDISKDDLENQIRLKQQLEAADEWYRQNGGKSLVKMSDGSAVDPAYAQYQKMVSTIKGQYQKLQDTKENYEQILAKMNEDKAKMGNVDLLLNLPILMASNIVQFSKFYANGYKTARKTGNIIGRAGEYAAEMTPLGGKIAVTKSALSEGLEEISQGAAARIAGDYYQTDVQNFYKSKMDPEAEQETLSWIKAFAQGINETVNDGSAWEEFFIGTLTGAMGIPGIKRKADGKLGIGINGGAYNEYQEYKEQMARDQEIADRLNERVKSPEFVNYYQGLIRHNKYQGMMNDAADRGDEFEYKNAEHAQFVSDIAMFDNAGKIEDLKTLIGEAFDTSDENLDAIVRNTTAKTEEGELVGPYAQYAQVDPESEQIVSNFGSEESKQEMIKKLTDSRDTMLESINNYVKIKNEIDINTGERLTDEQIEELTWMKSQIDDWSTRAVSVAGDVKGGIGNIVGYLSEIKAFNEHIRDIEGMSSSDLTDTYKKADENIKQLEQILNNLNIIRNASDAGAAYILAQEPKFAEGLIQQLQELPEKYLGQEFKDDLTRKIKDVVKLGNAQKAYKAKLEEYLKSPEKLTADRTKATEAVQKQSQEKAGNAIAQRFDWSKSLGEIATTLEENMGDIEANGGFDAFLKTLTPEQQNKLKKARALKKGVDGLRGLVDESALSDMQKRIADSLIEEAGKNADSIETLGNSLREALNNGEVAQRVAQALNSKESGGLNDLKVEEAIEDTEAKLREFLDDGIVKAANALEEAERMGEAKTDKDIEKEASAAEKAEKKEPDLKEPKEKKSPTLKEPTEPKGPKKPKEPPLNPPSEGETPQSPTEKVKKANDAVNENQQKSASPIQEGKNATQYSERPQLTQVYMHGYDLQTYPKYLEEHPEDIPSGVDAAAYTKYIKAVYQHLKEQGAFQYISNSLKVGDELEFVIDESLNERAGTPVILIQATDAEGGKHIIGSLPVAMEMNSKTNYTEEVDGKKVRKTSKKTLAEKRPGIKALHDKIMQEYSEWKKGDKSQPFSGGKTKVESLRGGVLPLSNRESTVSDIFEGTGQTPIIAVADENGSPSRFKDKDLDSPLMDPESAVQGQVYVMIPTNTGKYLPALTYSTPLADLSQEDWYMQRIIQAIKNMPNNLRELSGASHDLYRLIRIPGLSVQVGIQGKKTWTNTTDLTEATHLRLSYTNPKNPEKPSASLIPMTNGEMSEGDIWKAISGLIKAYPETTTSVDINKLGDSEDDIEYRNNIANYLHTNLVKGQAHAVNDWFTYEPTAVEKAAKGTQLGGYEGPKGKNGKVKADELIEGNPEADQIEVQGLASIDLGGEGDSAEKELGGLAFLARSEEPKGTFTVRKKPNIFGPRKRLEISRTTDSAASRKEIAKDIATIQKLFPQLSNANAVVLVRGLINTVNEKGDPVKAYGEFRDGILYISDQSPAGTAFHEAFHYITDMLMTPKERELMFQAARAKYGNLDRMELEERLAEDFRDYMNGYKGIIGALNGLYQRLKRIIDAIIGRTNYLDSLFYDIYNGSMSSRGPIAETDIFKQDLLKYKEKTLSFDNLDAETREFLSQRTSQEDYDNLDIEGKEDTLRCII